MFQISTLQPKKHKKISVVFDEELQILVSSEKILASSGFFIQGFYQHLRELGQLNWRGKEFLFAA